MRVIVDPKSASPFTRECVKFTNGTRAEYYFAGFLLMTVGPVLFFVDRANRDHGFSADRLSNWYMLFFLLIPVVLLAFKGAHRHAKRLTAVIPDGYYSSDIDKTALACLKELQKLYDETIYTALRKDVLGAHATNDWQSLREVDKLITDFVNALRAKQIAEARSARSVYVINETRNRIAELKEQTSIINEFAPREIGS